MLLLRSKSRVLPLDLDYSNWISALPIILEQMEAFEGPRNGAIALAKLVDGVEGEDAELLCEYMREAGVVEVLLLLLDEADPPTLQHTLMVIGNISSDTVDARAAETRAILLQADVMPKLLPALRAAETATAPRGAWGAQEKAPFLKIPRSSPSLACHARLRRQVRRKTLWARGPRESFWGG